MASNLLSFMNAGLIDRRLAGDGLNVDEPIVISSELWMRRAPCRSDFVRGVC